MFWYITRSSVFIWHIVQLILFENYLPCGKKWMFLKLVRWKAQILCWNERAVSGVLCKNIFVTDLLGSQHLFEILQTSHTLKNSENVVKSGCFESLLQWRAPIFSPK